MSGVEGVEAGQDRGDYVEIRDGDGHGDEGVAGEGTAARPPRLDLSGIVSPSQREKEEERGVDVLERMGDNERSESRESGFPARHNPAPKDNRILLHEALGAHSDMEYDEWDEDELSPEDFSTIDWAQYEEQHRFRSRRVKLRISKEPLVLKLIASAYEASQGWIALVIIGFSSGILASMVGIASDWAGDMRFGYCRGRGWWITEEVCCKDAATRASCVGFARWHQVFLPGGVQKQTELMVTYGVYVSISVLQAVLSCVLVVSLAPYAAGSGISEVKVILGGFVIKRFLGVMTLLVKVVGLVFSVGSGMNLGKEGPFVHVACCAANIVARFFSKYRSNEEKKRELYSCASAAGVAVAFGAPIGGVLFSLEEVSLYFPPKTMWRAFFCAMVAAMSLQRLNPAKAGKLVMFEVTYHHSWKLFEIIPFAFIGAVGGLIGAFVVHVNKSVCLFRKSTQLKHWPRCEVAAVCLITAAIDFPIVFLRGSNTGLLASLFSECAAKTGVVEELCVEQHSQDVVLLLIVSAGVKILLLLVTFGQKVPGGVFIPSLCIGALFGRAVGIAMQELHRYVGDVGPFGVCTNVSVCITPAIYAIVGGASVLGGVTRMTVSLVVIMMEVTDGLQYVIPLMVGVVLSKIVGDAFGKGTIYTEQIEAQGYPLLDHHTEIKTIEGAMEECAVDILSGRQMLVCLSAKGETIQSIEELLQEDVHNGYPVVTSQEDMRVVGYIRSRSLRRILAAAKNDTRVTPSTPVVFSSHADGDEAVLDLRGWMDKCPTIVFSTTPLANVIEMFRAAGLRYLLIVGEGKLVGIVKKKDLLEHIEYHNRLVRTTQSDGD